MIHGLTRQPGPALNYLAEVDASRQFDHYVTLETSVPAGVGVRTFLNESHEHMSESKLTKNIFLQAKRASKILDCSLTKSKHFIAQALYQCHDYDDLCNKLQSNSLKPTVYPFCHLHPNASENSINYLKNNVEFLCERFQTFLHKPLNTIPLINFVWSIFGLSRHTESLQLQPEILTSSWETHADFKDAAGCIFTHHIKINEVQFRLLAISVVDTGKFIDNTLREHIQIRNEFSKYRFAPIQWKKWASWQNEADSFLNTIGSSPAPKKLWFDKLTEPDNSVQMAFQDIIFEALGAIDDEFFCSQVQYSNFNGDAFYFLGYPISSEHDSESFYVTESHITNDKCLIRIRNNIIILQLFEIDDSGKYIGESYEFYKQLSGALQKFFGATRNVAVIAKKKYEIYIRSCTKIESEKYYNAPISIIDS